MMASHNSQTDDDLTDKRGPFSTTVTGSIENGKTKQLNTSAFKSHMQLRSQVTYDKEWKFPSLDDIPKPRRKVKADNQAQCPPRTPRNENKRKLSNNSVQLTEPPTSPLIKGSKPKKSKHNVSRGSLDEDIRNGFRNIDAVTDSNQSRKGQELLQKHLLEQAKNKRHPTLLPPEKVFKRVQKQVSHILSTKSKDTASTPEYHQQLPTDKIIKTMQNAITYISSYDTVFGRTDTFKRIATSIKRDIRTVLGKAEAIKRQKNPSLSHTTPLQPLPSVVDPIWGSICGHDVRESEICTLRDIDLLDSAVLDFIIEKTCQVSNTNGNRIINIPIHYTQLLHAGSPEGINEFKFILNERYGALDGVELIIFTVFFSTHFYIITGDIAVAFFEVFDSYQLNCDIDSLKDDMYAKEIHCDYDLSRQKLDETLQKFRERCGTSKSEYLKEILEDLCKEMIELTGNPEWTYHKEDGSCPFVKVPEIPVQKDGVNCGVLDIAYIQKLSYLPMSFTDCYDDMLSKLSNGELRQFLVTWAKD